MPAATTSKSPPRENGILTNLAETDSQRFTSLFGGGGHGQEGLYSLCGIAIDQTASNAERHSMDGGRVGRQLAFERVAFTSKDGEGDG